MIFMPLLAETQKVWDEIRDSRRMVYMYFTKVMG